MSVATRVRKLARELRVGPETVLGVLHALGIERYRSPEDMLPDAAVNKVRKGLQKGVRPVPVDVVGLRRAVAPQQPGPARDGNDLMQQLVPGVQREGRPARPGQTSEPSSVPRVSQAQRRALDARAVELAEREAELSARLQALIQREEALELDVRRLDREREALRADRESEPTESVVEVLRRRGLKGRDELDRAVSALAATRACGDLLEMLVPADPSAVLDFLNERLLLVGGTVPAGIGRLAAVTVAPERADVPGDEVLGRLIARVGEEMMLSGLRRVLIVGGPSVWQRMVRERLDPRIELRVLLSEHRTEAQARDDVAQSDVIVLWMIDEEDSARQVYEAEGRVVVRVTESSPAALFEGWISALTR